MNDKFIGDGITFDDVSLVPAKSSVLPSQVDTSTQPTCNIRINIPLVSAAMDTVTELALAIALAQEGGIGVIHRNLSVEAQAIEVDRVKRSENGVISDPNTLPSTASVEQARRMMRDYGISGIPVVDDGRLVGILTRRDLKFHPDSSRLIADVMTKALITAPPGTTLEQAKAILNRNKVEKLLLVDDKMTLQGLITIKDIDKLEAFPLASRDGRGRLRVGGAIGPDDDARAEALVAQGVDVLVLDTAHGHSVRVVEAARRLKSSHPAIELIVGNIVTGEAAADLIDAGADAVKVGVGPGSICTTRAVAGVGVPQVTAVMNCARAADSRGVPVIADGGIRYSGDIAKAIAAGAHSVMIGSLFAGLDESPGEMVYYRGRAFKVCRGMGSIGAMVAGSSSRYQQEGAAPDKLVPEGVEGRVPYHGLLGPFVYQLVGGLRAGMGYCGAAAIEDLRTSSRFVRVTPAGRDEGHPHDIAITKEAPNYRLGTSWR